MLDTEFVKYLVGLLVGFIFLAGYLFGEWTIGALLVSMFFLAEYTSKILRKLFGKGDGK